MNDMTEEDADALYEYFTKNLSKVSQTKGGITTRQGFRMVVLDRVSSIANPSNPHYTYPMAITQTVEIPPDRWITLEVPREVPTGSVVLTFTPAGAAKKAAMTEDEERAVQVPCG